jgi:hypothetical protein
MACLFSYTVAVFVKLIYKLKLNKIMWQFSWIALLKLLQCDGVAIATW